MKIIQIANVVVTARDASRELNAQDVEDLIALIERDASRLVGLLAVSTGGGPSPAQRRRIAMVVQRCGLRAAVVNDNAMSRGMVTALGWLGLSIAAFGLDDIDGAASFLRVDPRKRDELLAAVAQIAIEAA